MGKMSKRKVNRLMNQVAGNNVAYGRIQGLEEAAGMKSIAEVRTAARQQRAAWDAAIEDRQRKYDEERVS